MEKREKKKKTEKGKEKIKKNYRGERGVRTGGKKEEIQERG